MKSPQWGEIVALACAESRKSIVQLATIHKIPEWSAEIDRVLDGCRVRKGSALERRVSHLAVSCVAHIDLVRLGMTADAIDRALLMRVPRGAPAFETVGDVARSRLAKMDRRAA